MLPPLPEKESTLMMLSEYKSMKRALSIAMVAVYLTACATTTVFSPDSAKVAKLPVTNGKSVIHLKSGETNKMPWKSYSDSSVTLADGTLVLWSDIKSVEVSGVDPKKMKDDIVDGAGLLLVAPIVIPVAAAVIVVCLPLRCHWN